MSKVKDQGNNVSRLMNGAVLAIKNVQMILLQEDITLSALPYLPAHQEAARVHAKKWEGIWKAILFTTSEIIDFANTFNSSYQELLQLADTLENGTEEEKAIAKPNFLTGLNQLMLATLKDKQIIAAQITTNTEVFYKSFLPDYNNFLYDFNIAAKIIKKDDESLDDLTADLAKAKAKALRLEIGIGMSAETSPFTIAGVYPAGPFSVIVGGILFSAIEIRDLIEMSREYADAMKEVHSIQDQITDVKPEMIQLQEVETQITGLLNASLNIMEGAKSVENGWLALSSDIEMLINLAEAISPEDVAFMVTVELSIMNTDWQTVLELTKKLQPIGEVVGHKTFKTVDNMLQAITPNHYV